MLWASEQKKEKETRLTANVGNSFERKIRLANVKFDNATTLYNIEYFKNIEYGKCL